MTVPPDVPFAIGGATPNFAFIATGGTQVRTTSDRLDDIINVKEFGAKGDGITDDGAAILAAITYAFTSPATAYSVNLRGGTVFFPAGTYFIDSSHFPIALHSSDGKGSLRLVGAGRDASIIVGNYSTGVVDASNHFNAMFWKVFPSTLEGISDLTIWNQSSSPSATCCIINSAQSAPLYENVHFIAPRGLLMEQECYGEVFRNCIFTCGSPLLINRADSATATPLTGTVGLIHGQGTVENCRFEGFALGLGLANGAINPGTGLGETSASIAFEISGNYFYRCTVGMTGASTISVDAMEGAVIVGNQFERCTWGMYLNNIVHSCVISNRVGGIRNNLGAPTDPSPITPTTGMVLSGGTVTVTTSAAHNIASSGVIALVGINPPSFIPPNAIWSDGLGSGLVNATRINSTSFSYSHSGAASGFVSGSWNYPMQFGITAPVSSSTNYSANVLDAPVSLYSFDADHFGTSQNSYQCMCSSMQFPFGSKQPAHGSDTPMGWDFMMCDGPSLSNPPNVYLQYGDLSPRYEGQVRTIVDAASAATFRAVVSAGGSSNRYKVRWTGSNWVRIA